jgi:hypothetical protein
MIQGNRFILQNADEPALFIAIFKGANFIR